MHKISLIYFFLGLLVFSFSNDKLHAIDSRTEVEEAYKFFILIQDEDDFDVGVTKKFTLQLRPICLDTLEPGEFRSYSCYVLARLHGKLADKLRMNGVNDAKQMFLFVKESLKCNPQNSLSALFYGEALIGVYDEGPIGRRTAARLLGLDLKQELQNAKKILEGLGLQDHEIFKRILQIGVQFL